MATAIHVDVGSDVDHQSDTDQRTLARSILDLTREHELLRRRAEGLLLTSLIEVDRLGLYRANGYTDVGAWGRGELRWDAIEARSRRGLTRLAQQVPDIIDRLLTGRLGVAQAHLLGRLYRSPRVGRFVPDFIESFFTYAAEMSFHQFEHYCHSWRLLMDQDGTLPNPAGRTASLAFTDTEFRLTVVGPAIDGATWQAQLQRLVADQHPGGASTTVNIVADLPTWLHQLDRLSGLPGAAPGYEPSGRRAAARTPSTAPRCTRVTRCWPASPTTCDASSPTAPDERWR